MNSDSDVENTSIESDINGEAVKNVIRKKKMMGFEKNNLDVLPPTSEDFQYYEPLFAKKFEKQCEQIISMALPITETSIVTLSFIW